MNCTCVGLVTPKLLFRPEEAYQVGSAARYRLLVGSQNFAPSPLIQLYPHINTTLTLLGPVLGDRCGKHWYLF